MKQRERTKKEQRMDNQRTYEQMEGISISAKAKRFFTENRMTLDDII